MVGGAGVHAKFEEEEQLGCVQVAVGRMHTVPNVRILWTKPLLLLPG